MRNQLLFFFLFILLGGASIVQAQDVPEIIKRNLEATAETNGLDDSGIKELQEYLDHYRKHPLNLNRVKAEDLRRLHILTDLQIESFIKYRNEFGNLISIYELQAIPGWDIIIIQEILPFITIDVNNEAGYLFKKSQSLKMELYRTLEKAKGYDSSLNNHYLGNPYGMMLTYLNRYNSKLQFGFTATKDPGEPFFKQPNISGFDFYSFNVQVHNKGIIKNAVFGDYTISLGQGLIYWQSLSFSKYADITGIKKQGDVIGAYRSTNEFNFKRGLAVTIQKGKFELTPFVSFRKISGHLNTDTVEFFTSLLTNGYHRTASEINQKNRISLFSLGGNITYQNKNLNIGINSAFDYFSKPFIKSSAPYNYYAFSGQRLFNNSISYGYTYYNMHLFGEYAIDQNLHPALIQGALVSLSKAVDVSLLYRYLPPSYESVFGKAFTENSQPSNENGLSTGIIIRPFQTLKMNASIDYYKSPWLKYRVSAPSSGTNYFLQLQYLPKTTFEFLIDYRERTTSVNSVDSTINYPQVNKSSHLILGSNWKTSNHTEFRYRLELTNNQSNGISNEGFLSYMEYRKQFNKRFLIDGRLEYIESPVTTIYTYISTNTTSSLSALKGTGYNYHILLKYSPMKNLGLQLFLDQTIYMDRQIIGSGTDLINGNKRTEVHLKMEWSLNK